MSCHLLSREKACRRRQPPGQRRHVPIYPYIRTTVLNSSQVYMKFTIQFGLGLDITSSRSAWLDTTVGPDNTTVKIYLERLGCTPYQKATIQTLTTLAGLGVAASVPSAFSSTNTFTGSSFVFGCTEEIGTGRLTWGPPSAFGSDFSDTNFVLSPINLVATYLQTGISNTVASAGNDRALRALPTDDDAVFELAWKSVASTEGYPITLVNLIYPDSCPPCGSGAQLGENC